MVSGTASLRHAAAPEGKLYLNKHLHAKASSFRQEGTHDILEFRLELSNGTSPAQVETSVREHLSARYPDIWANHECGMYRLAFRFVPRGTLGTARKPRRLVDERSA